MALFLVSFFIIEPLAVSANNPPNDTNVLTNPTKKELEKITNEATQKLNTNNQMAISMPNNQLNPTDNNKFPPVYVAELMTLVLGAPEFQRK